MAAARRRPHQGADRTRTGTVPVGPYRLAVIPTVRGRSAGQVALQGMPNKQIELLTPRSAPAARPRPGHRRLDLPGRHRRIVYLDFKSDEKYILWHAPNAQPFNFDDPADLNHMLFNLGMEVPDQLDRVLTKKFRPQDVR